MGILFFLFTLSQTRYFQTFLPVWRYCIVLPHMPHLTIFENKFLALSVFPPPALPGILLLCLMISCTLKNNPYIICTTTSILLLLLLLNYTVLTINWYFSKGNLETAYGYFYGIKLWFSMHFYWLIWFLLPGKIVSKILNISW